MAVKTLKHGVATFANNANTRSIAMSPGPGNFSISEVEAGNVSAVAVINRGNFHELVEGAERSEEFSITLKHDGALRNAGAATVWNAILGLDQFASDASADPGTLVWTGNVTLVSTRSGAVDTHTMKNCRMRAGYSEAEDGNEITVSGTAYGSGAGAKDAYTVTSA